MGVNLAVVVGSMAGSDSSFTAVSTFCKEVISQKEAEEVGAQPPLGPNSPLANLAAEARFQHLMPF